MREILLAVWLLCSPLAGNERGLSGSLAAVSASFVNWEVPEQKMSPGGW